MVKLLSGRGRDVHWVLYLIGALLVLYFVFLRALAG